MVCDVVNEREELGFLKSVLHHIHATVQPLKILYGVAFLWMCAPWTDVVQGCIDPERKGGSAVHASATLPPEQLLHLGALLGVAQGFSGESCERVAFAGGEVWKSWGGAISAPVVVSPDSPAKGVLLLSRKNASPARRLAPSSWGFPADPAQSVIDPPGIHRPPVFGIGLHAPFAKGAAKPRVPTGAEPLCFGLSSPATYLHGLRLEVEPALSFASETGGIAMPAQTGPKSPHPAKPKMGREIIRAFAASRGGSFGSPRLPALGAESRENSSSETFSTPRLSVFGRAVWHGCNIDDMVHLHHVFPPADMARGEGSRMTYIAGVGQIPTFLRDEQGNIYVNPLDPQGQGA